MKSRLLDTFCASAIYFVSLSANAALIDRGGGLIYDDVQNITWLQDANYAFTSGYINTIETSFDDGRMDWFEATVWADQLVFGGYDDWRLPTTPHIDESCSAFGIQDGITINWGYSCVGSELGHLYIEGLGNLGYQDSNGVFQPDFGLKNTGVFYNLQKDDYWSGSEYLPFDDNAWYFSFEAGGYQGGNKQFPDIFFAWAVRDGDVAAVPIPSALWMLSSGLLGLIGVFRNNRIKNT